MSITRKIDALGRLSIPSDWRNQLGMEKHSTVEIDIQNGSYLTIKPASTDLNTKIKSEIDVLQKQLNEGLRKKEKLQTQYALEILEDLLRPNR